MKNWRNSEPFLKRDGGCRHCGTSGSMKKLKDVMSKAADKFRNLWGRRKRERDHNQE